MPMYDFRCSDGHEFEDMAKVADRKKSRRCLHCRKMAKHVILRGPMFDPKMGLDPDFPTASAQFRKNGEARGRGKDMTRANKTVGEDIARDAHAVRQALGENPIISSG